VLNLTYGYDAGNNGSVASSTNNLLPERTQTFTYDTLNRLATAQTQATSGPDCWGQSFGYDRYANLLSINVTKCTAPSLSLSVNNQNQITNPGFSYDAAGNMTADGTYTYTWDAESHLKSAASVNYTYDGDGQRVKKDSGTLFWYGVNGELLAETDLAGNNLSEYVYFSGKRTARRDNSGAVYYSFSDHLGSLRVMTDATGNIQRDSDYYPFGGERVVTGIFDDAHKFAGMFRDTETGLDHTLYRQYNSALGRWLSTDPQRGLPCTPQTLNLYPYVTNNPTNRTDPKGNQCWDWWDSGYWEYTYIWGWGCYPYYGGRVVCRMDYLGYIACIGRWSPFLLMSSVACVAAANACGAAIATGNVIVVVGVCPVAAVACGGAASIIVHCAVENTRCTWVPAWGGGFGWTRYGY
jgi:RHS repeat-associated protein